MNLSNLQEVVGMAISKLRVALRSCAIRGSRACATTAHWS